ncbi:ATP synthase gamma chain [Candidatus Westeberhardia cardiocondylae]|uniref:ATP synthase gamma chain n=1 Tax=Candidatus Westeberhardia cardiocondylae TaxID=1594731 RepID=A0A0H5BWE8_9ENTR|nr:ATP synthase F1 subunit gamma [Candidatus Westeberhardia cardiocondylae]CEN31980.1 ATP synthase gamma chain [Candidatus Westeberhardia cardiocondylae]
MTKREIYNKISVFKRVKKVTKVMEMVSASKMKKLQKFVKIITPYEKKICEIVQRMLLNNTLNHSYMITKKVKCVGYFVFFTDHGLVGSFNINLFRKLIFDVVNWNKKGVMVELLLFGNKCASFFKNIDGVRIISKVVDIGNKPKLSKLNSSIQIMLSRYEKGKLNKIYIVSNRFISVVLQNPSIIQILPICDVFDKNCIKKYSFLHYLYEPNFEILFNVLLFKYIETKVYFSMIEHLICEQASRMVAMKTATDNGDNLLKELKLIYNKIRQNSVTTEISEIIAGASLV